MHEGSDPTWTGSHNFTSAEITLPTTDPDAEGMIGFKQDAWDTNRGAVSVYDGTALTYVVAALASDSPSDGQIPKWHTGGTVTWEPDDDSGGAPQLQNITDPQSDAEFEAAANVNINWLFSGVNTTGSMFQVQQTGNSTGGNLFSVTQSAGDPSGGTLLSVTGNDANITNTWLGDTGVTHGWRVYEASANVYTLDNVGSAVLNLDAANDLLINGTAYTATNWATSGTLTVTGASATLPATSFGDANITNVGSIALDSIGADATNISMVAASGTVTVESVVFTGVV